MAPLLHAHTLDGLDDVVHATDDTPEDDVFAVEPGGVLAADEELGSVGVGPGVDHGHRGHLVVLAEILVGELVAVDGPAGAGAGVILRKSPPWQMKPGMMGWKMEPLKESG